MTPWDLRNIHTTRDGCRDTLPCGTWHWNYTCWCKTSWLPLPRLVSLISGYVQYLPPPPSRHTHTSLWVPPIFKNHRQKNTFRHNFPQKNYFIHCISIYYLIKTRRTGLVSCSMHWTCHIRSYWTQLDTICSYIWDILACQCQMKSL